MKVVINKCFGGFSLSPYGVQRLAELRGDECYFFVQDYKQGGVDAPYRLVTVDEAAKSFMFSAFKTVNPNDELRRLENWHEQPLETRKAWNEKYQSLSNSERDIDRHDPLLVKTVEELGEQVNGQCAKLVVVEIPDGVEYEISEYDGNEHIAEVHRTWA